MAERQDDDGMSDTLTRLIRGAEDPGSAVVVVSPHLDDAVLSTGALVAHLAGKCPVTVLTVFTEAGEPPAWGLAARQHLRDLGVTDAEALFEERRAEDIAVLEEMHVESVHLGLRDALFRLVGEPTGGRSSKSRRATYPTFRFHAGRGRIALSDAGLASEVGTAIRDIAAARRASMVFGPLGIGRHVDHLITRHAIEGLEFRTIYYSDFPYSERDVPDPGFVRRASLVPYPWLSGRIENSHRMAGYRTQFQGLFPHGVPTRPEIYWVPANDAAAAA